MKKWRIGASIAILSLGVSAAHASMPFTAQVTNVGTYGDGSIFIFLNVTLNVPGCTVGSRIDVASSNPNVKQILAIAMAAMVSWQTVQGWVIGCDPTLGLQPLIHRTAHIFI